MQILWLKNSSLPEASFLLGEKPSPFGGWIVSSAEAISISPDINLSIAFPKKSINTYKRLEGKNINFYPFPAINISIAYSPKENIDLLNIIEDVRPDIVHIFGTEYPHSFVMSTLCKERNIRTIIHIQGLVSIIAHHYYSDLPPEIIRSYTFRDFVKNLNIQKQQRQFMKRGSLEIETIKNVNYIAGRTSWDRACTSHINNEAVYYSYNETLREIFYRHVWKYEDCEPYTVFISQATYPIKGLHYMIEAMHMILQYFPNTKLFIAGHDITNSKTIRDRLKKSTYTKYIMSLIKKYNIKDRIFFTGLLDEKHMCDRFLKSHVFVCPSSIENSPNSLCEAMIIGVPCVASYVGGIPDLLTHGNDGFLYQHNAPYMLAHYVCEIFSNREIAEKLSNNARKRAQDRHDRIQNTDRLISIYNDILSDGESI